jgi:hypothetical protein
LTSSSPSRAKDFFRKTAMSRREDIEHRVDLAGQAAKPLSVLVIHPQAKGANGGNSIAGYLYRIQKSEAITPW